MKLKNIVKVIRNADKAFNALNVVTEESEQLQYVIGMARHKKIIPDFGNFGIGTAIELAKQYNLEYSIGTCFGDCCAILNKEDWKYRLDKSVPSTEYGTFIVMSPDDIKYITGFGKTITTAVLRCLINAKTAGVI